MSVPRLTKENKDYYLKRTEKVTPDAVPQWGSLTPMNMVHHLGGAIDLSLGKMEVSDHSTFFSRHVILNLILLFTQSFPKNVKTDKSFPIEANRSIEEERKLLRDKMDEFFAEVEKNPKRKTLHPFFGWLTLRQWSQLHGIHFEHHLKQFEC